MCSLGEHMLDELRVRDLALIEQAALEFSPALTVLTGETGAGKTALLAAIKLLIGDRADATMVRDGAPEARVEARFIGGQMGTGQRGAVPLGIHPPDASQEHIVTRRVGRDGRSKCLLDDAMVTVGALAAQVGPLVDLHGQHEHQALLRPTVQLDYLDRFAGGPVAQALAAYQDAWHTHREARELVERLAAAAHTSALAIEQARYTLQEIDRVGPRPAEYEELEEQLPRLRNGEDLAQASNAALEALRREDGAFDALAAAQHELARLQGIDTRLDGLASRLDTLAVVAEDLAAELREYRDGVEFDPQALEEALDRLGQLEGLRKRFGPRMEDVFITREEAQQALASTEGLDGKQEKARQQLEAAHTSLQEAACVLKDARAKGATVFAAALTACVQDLAMEGASFEVAVTPLDEHAWTAQGSCSYEVRYRPAPRTTPRALARIASGGELSRVMLALKTLLRDAHTQATLVFDEIDAGVGGATATAVARRLQQLATTHQVIVVTHLAQIAAVAQSHWVVRKTVCDGATQTTIEQACGEDRVVELARMLAGSDSATALDHARQLLGAAATPVATTAGLGG